ncbi:MAG TPA: hypothetical protein VGH33_01110 [Isosphaeraceae bacterium]
MRIGVGLSRAIGLAAMLALPGGHALGQFGYGMGFGFYQPGSMSQQMLDGWALQNGARATMGPVQNNVYAGNPNAFIHRLREPGVMERYDPETRREMESRVGRFSHSSPPSRRVAASAPAAVPVAAAPSPAAPEVPLASFFDRYQKLVWPHESPVHGDLGPARGAADLASLAVLNDQALHGLARVGTVTEARTKLVDYGRPALIYMRENTTARIADTFHLFMLSLYESLGQAATVPRTPAPAPQP